MPSELVLQGLQGVAAETVARQVAESVNHSMAVAAVASRAYAITRDPEKGLQRPPGMSDAEWNICVDALSSKRNVPAYLAFHFEQAALAQKLEGMKNVGLPPIASMVGVLIEQKKYPVIDVTPVKEE